MLRQSLPQRAREDGGKNLNEEDERTESARSRHPITPSSFVAASEPTNGDGTLAAALPLSFGSPMSREEREQLGRLQRDRRISEHEFGLAQIAARKAMEKGRAEEELKKNWSNVKGRERR